ncbi:MAG: retropepsin-like aspartic protease [Candidatus Zixiibacteriota bacterium]
MSVTRLAIALSHLLLTATALAAGVEIPFDPVRGLVEVPVVIDGRVKGTFGIDTGADRLYIDSSFAHENGLTSVASPPQRAVVGVDGVSEASFVKLRSLRLGKEGLYNITATAIDLTQIIKDRRLGMPDGLIGYDILRRFFVTVDYPKRMLRLDVSPPPFTRGSADAFPFIRYRSERHMIVVEATLNDSIRVPMALDYCASYTTLSPSLASRLALDPSKDGPQKVDRVSLEGLSDAQDVLVVVADLSRFKKAVKGSTIDGIIGASFLYRHKFTIDYKAERIYIHR